MPETRQTQLVVIGAGPGGYAAAFAAADRGIKTVIVDSDPNPGGVCLNRGCIPSKALLHVARLINEAREASAWGVSFAEPKLDIDAIRKWKESVVAKNAGGVKMLAKSRGVEIIRAWARFENSTTLLLSSEKGGEPDLGRLVYDKCILATGSRPAVIPAFNINSPRVIDSTGALELPDVPRRFLVIGGGYIGLEMGTAYAALGSEVTVVEATDGLLPGADRDLVRVLQNRLKRTFKQILVSTRVARLADTGTAVNVTFEGEAVGEGKAAVEQAFDRVLVSVGRTPNTQDLGLENTKVKVLPPRGFVEVDEKRQTGDGHIYAIGDIAGEPMLAHKASKEAKVAVEAIAGEKAAFDVRAIPGVVFTDPEIAWAGLTEAQAKAKGVEIEIAKFPWGASGRATAIGRNDGLTKIIVNPNTKHILGIGIVGVGAGELIAEGVLAIEMGATAEDVGLTIHAHPTLSETVAECAELAYGTTTHVYRPPR
jgi:dihydrolipoamide dehydrogenase